jgi:hypothetical protein
METLYRKVNTADRLPREEGTYKTNRQQDAYYKDGEFYEDVNDFRLHKPCALVTQWLEPIPDAIACKIIEAKDLKEGMKVFRGDEFYEISNIVKPKAPFKARIDLSNGKSFYPMPYNEYLIQL